MKNPRVYQWISIGQVVGLLMGMVFLGGKFFQGSPSYYIASQIIVAPLGGVLVGAIASIVITKNIHSMFIAIFRQVARILIGAFAGLVITGVVVIFLGLTVFQQYGSDYWWNATFVALLYGPMVGMIVYGIINMITGESINVEDGMSTGAIEGIFAMSSYIPLTTVKGMYTDYFISLMTSVIIGATICFIVGAITGKLLDKSANGIIKGVLGATAIVGVGTVFGAYIRFIGGGIVIGGIVGGIVGLNISRRSALVGVFYGSIIGAISGAIGWPVVSAIVNAIAAPNIGRTVDSPIALIPTFILLIFAVISYILSAWINKKLQRNEINE